MDSGVPAGRPGSYIGTKSARRLKSGDMVRAISIFGMGGGFLMISPRLRMGLTHTFSVTSDALNQYTPYSYIAVALGIFALLTMSLYRSNRR